MERLSALLAVLLITVLVAGCQIGNYGEQESTSMKKAPGQPEEIKDTIKESPANEEKVINEKSMEGREVSGKMKALMIIAKTNFRDEEYVEPRKVLEANGIEVIVASSSLATARGMLGTTIKPDILIDDVVVSNYDAIIFVGGSGAEEYYANQKALSIAKESVDSGKVLAAICIAPVILANAGVLNGKRATVFSSKIANIKAKGAIYVSKDVVQDGNIITACGPGAANAFGKAIVGAMK